MAARHCGHTFNGQNGIVSGRYSLSQRAVRQREGHSWEMTWKAMLVRKWGFPLKEPSAPTTIRQTHNLLSTTLKPTGRWPRTGMSLCVVWGQQEGTGRRRPGVLGHQQLRVLTTHPAQGMSQEGGRRTNRRKDRRVEVSRAE